MIVSVIEKPIEKGLVKENHVKEDCERVDELEACRSYSVKVLHQFVSVLSVCNL